MKMKLLVFLAAASLLAGAACSSGTTTTVQTEGSATTTERTGPGGNVETTTVTGVVTKYEAGNEIEVRGSDGNMHDFDLEDSVRIEGTIEIGKPATISYTEQDGIKRVTVVTSQMQM